MKAVPDNFVVDFAKEKETEKDYSKPTRFMIEEKQLYVIEAESEDEAREEFDCLSLEAKDKLSKSSVVSVERLGDE